MNKLYSMIISTLSNQVTFRVYNQEMVTVCLDVNRAASRVATNCNLFFSNVVFGAGIQTWAVKHCDRHRAFKERYLKISGKLVSLQGSSDGVIWGRRIDIAKALKLYDIRVFGGDIANLRGGTCWRSRWLGRCWRCSGIVCRTYRGSISRLRRFFQCRPHGRVSRNEGWCAGWTIRRALCRIFRRRLRGIRCGWRF